ncbi:TonB-dependent receptor [Rhodocaloribacter litoris]|uniref:TonB-dependent receptor n=1 Tax=Rhodocaloribacter litoris TaxID=2558931 RepID=UPI001E533FD5|nr:TonB-dependent receptor [Rhodocaloribacter litoris]QXD14758.1 TonB-dependent receptor [Rhodocaloribacter litoris]GIV59157.1 MAG: TonB-dependent receptor [Rhodothermaceae bacterium]
MLTYRRTLRPVPAAFWIAGLLCWVLGPTAVPAQPATVHGFVADETGRPLAGASAVLMDAATGQQRYGTATGLDGTFRLERVRPGAYRLAVTFVGYAAHEEPVEVAGGATLEVRVRLVATAIPQPEVVVTETRARPGLTPITYSNLTARDLEVQPAMKDLPVHLATLPSITYYSENGNGIGYSYLRMRGFDQRRLAVAINGVPQNDPEEHNVFWINFFDIEGSVEDIQVQRGAASAFYGPTAIGGAINIVAMPYRPYPYAEVELGYGTFDTQQYSVEANTGLLADRFIVYGRFSRLRSDGYRDWSWTRFTRFFAGVRYLTENATWTLQAYGGPQRDGLAFSGIPKAANKEALPDGSGGVIDRRYNASAFSGDVEDFHQPHVELHHEWRLAPDWRLSQVAFWIRGIGYFDFDGSFRSANYLRLPDGFVPEDQRDLPLFIVKPEASVFFRAFLDQWQLGWMPRLTHAHAGGETTFGAEARLHRSLRWGRIQEATGLPAHLVGPENDVRVYSFRGEKAIVSAFVSHRFRPHARLAVQADAQLTYRHYRIYDEAFFGNRFKKPYVFFNPRLGVTFNPERPFSAYASVALAGREPRMKSLYDGEEAGAGFTPRFERRPDGSLDVDRPFVKPEHLVDVEAGVAVRRPRYRLAANLFFMDFRDEIVPSGGLDQFGVPRTGNAEHTRHVGLEVEAALRLAPGLDLTGNATLSRNRFVAFTEYVVQEDGTTAGRDRSGNPIAGFPEQTANLGLRYQRHGLTASVHARFAGKQYVDNTGGRLPDGTRSPERVVDPYTLVDASFRYAFPEGSPFRGLALAFDVNNVFDGKVLLFGNEGFGTPQFFPAATRHVFAGLTYTLR